MAGKYGKDLVGQCLLLVNGVNDGTQGEDHQLQQQRADTNIPRDIPTKAHFSPSLMTIVVLVHGLHVVFKETFGAL